MSLSLMKGHHLIEFVASERLRKTFSVHFFAQYFTCIYKTLFMSVGVTFDVPEHIPVITLLHVIMGSVYGNFDLWQGFQKRIFTVERGLTAFMLNIVYVLHCSLH